MLSQQDDVYHKVSNKSHDLSYSKETLFSVTFLIRFINQDTVCMLFPTYQKKNYVCGVSCIQPTVHTAFEGKIRHQIIFFIFGHFYKMGSAEIVVTVFQAVSL
jgi:hypothetical protein